MIKRLVFVAIMITLTTGAAYAAYFATSVSEASVLMIWGGALLVLAHQARPRTTHALAQPAVHFAGVVRAAKPERPAAAPIRLQPGV